MEQKNITTFTLLQRLFKTSSLDRFINRYKDEMEAVPKFCDYINQLCIEKGVSVGSVLSKTDIERTYGHKIFNGTRKPTRDRVIQLAFGFEMDYDELQKLLSVARKSPLYPKVKRDAIIIYALQHKFDMTAVQNELLKMSVPILGEVR